MLFCFCGWLLACFLALCSKSRKNKGPMAELCANFFREKLPEKLTSLKTKSLIGEERTNKREKKSIIGEERVPKMSVSQVDWIVGMVYLMGPWRLKINVMDKGFLSSRMTFRGVQVPKKQAWINCIYGKAHARCFHSGALQNIRICFFLLFHASP